MRTLASRIASNTGLPCMGPRCPRTRYGASRYCRKCRHANTTHGSPNGRKIAKTEYRGDRNAVEQLLAKHGDHEGVRIAERWIAEWIKKAAEARPQTPAQAALIRLFRQAVEPRSILVEAAAVWSFATRNPHSLPDDMRLTMALGTAIAHVVPTQFLYEHKGCYRYKRVAPTAKRDIGVSIRQTLGLLLVRIAEGVADKERRTQQQRHETTAALGSPFSHSITDKE